MIDHKIPASIILAQGILESGSGNSDLAKKGNNHFGIKCKDWTGEKMYIDDDIQNECFRVYSNSEESFIDHSNFLTSKTRYSKLFTLESTNYKAWATELKNAGYATNPKYPQLLIKIIEELKLYEFDTAGNPNTIKVPETNIVKTENEESNEISINLNKHSVLTHANKVKYVVAKKGDTFYRISKEFNLGLWQLYRYNNFDAKKDVLEIGDIIYIQPKKNRSKEKKSTYKVDSPISLRQFSQQEALKLNCLIKRNKSISPDEKIQTGNEIVVR